MHPRQVFCHRAIFPDLFLLFILREGLTKLLAELEILLPWPPLWNYSICSQARLTGASKVEG